MRRVLMIAGAALICAAPALADDVTVEKQTTVTKELVPAEPHSGSTVATVIVAPEAPPPPRVEVRPEPPQPGMAWMEGTGSGTRSPDLSLDAGRVRRAAAAARRVEPRPLAAAPGRLGLYAGPLELRHPGRIVRRGLPRRTVREWKEGPPGQHGSRAPSDRTPERPPDALSPAAACASRGIA